MLFTRPIVCILAIALGCAAASQSQCLSRKYNKHPTGKPQATSKSKEDSSSNRIGHPVKSVDPSGPSNAIAPRAILPTSNMESQTVYEVFSGRVARRMKTVTGAERCFASFLTIWVLLTGAVTGLFGEAIACATESTIAILSRLTLDILHGAFECQGPNCLKLAIDTRLIAAIVVALAYALR